MKNPCEIVARYLLPAFRSLIAQRLIEEYRFSQMDTAAKLGTTQAAISQYLSSKRGEKYIKQIENNPFIMSMISEIINAIMEGTISSVDVSTRLCDVCRSVREQNLISLISPSMS